MHSNLFAENKTQHGGGGVMIWDCIAEAGPRYLALNFKTKTDNGVSEKTKYQSLIMA